MCKENAILPSSDSRLYCNLNSFPTEEHEKIIKQHCCTTTNCDLTRFFAAVHIGNSIKSNYVKMPYHTLTRAFAAVNFSKDFFAISNANI